MNTCFFLFTFLTFVFGKATINYNEAADEALKDLKEIVEADKSVWPNLEKDEDGIKVFSRPSPFPELKENILLLEVTVEASLNKTAQLLLPWGEYRTKWDDIYDFIRVVQNLSDNAVVVHDAVHSMFLLSARDAVDVCKEERFEDKILMACRNTTHEDVGISDSHVRTFQRLVGYQLEPYSKDPHWTDVKLVFGADLNLSVSFFSSLVNRFKPGQLIDFVGRLRSAIQEYKIE